MQHDFEIPNIAWICRRIQTISSQLWQTRASASYVPLLFGFNFDAPLLHKWSICVSHEINCKWRKNQSNQFEANKKFCFSLAFRLCHFSIIFRFFIQVACYLLLLCAFFLRGYWVLAALPLYFFHLSFE